MKTKIGETNLAYFCTNLPTFFSFSHRILLFPKVARRSPEGRPKVDRKKAIGQPPVNRRSSGTITGSNNQITITHKARKNKTFTPNTTLFQRFFGSKCIFL